MKPNQLPKLTTQEKAASPWQGQQAAKKHNTLASWFSPIDRLLPLLQRVKRTGPSTWMARCPTREDKCPSLTIRELDDGRILLHDFGGDSTGEILAAIGLSFSDLFPPRAVDHRVKPERRPFSCADTFRAIGFEATIIALAGAAIIAGEPLAIADKDRLLIAVGRINDALTAAGVNHD